MPVVDSLARFAIPVAFFISILCVSLGSTASAALEENLVIALDPAAGKAVVQTPDGNLEVIAIGDTFPGSSVIVTGILKDRVVCEEIVDGEKSVRREVWVYRANAGDSVSRVERLFHEAPKVETPDFGNTQLLYGTGGEAGQ